MELSGATDRTRNNMGEYIIQLYGCMSTKNNKNKNYEHISWAKTKVDITISLPHLVNIIKLHDIIYPCN